MASAKKNTGTRATSSVSPKGRASTPTPPSGTGEKTSLPRARQNAGVPKGKAIPLEATKSSPIPPAEITLGQIPADARVETVGAEKPVRRTQPPGGGKAGSKSQAPRTLPPVPLSEERAVPPPHADSQPPLPSSLTGERRSLRPSLPAAAFASLRPRLSLRPAGHLTGLDLAMDKDSLKQTIASHVEYSQGKDEFSATLLDYYYASARATRDRLFDRWNKTQQSYYRQDQKRVYYLSLEFLLGRLFEDALINLGIHGPMETALNELGLSLADLAEAEVDAGLGNGGLGRLAACFLDSMATVGIAGTGYGIRYEYGIFEQQIVDGRQIERADNWLRFGSPWEVKRPEQRHRVRFGGRVVLERDAVGREVYRWVDTEDVWAIAHDYLIPGYGNDIVNTLRLWGAQATRGFHFEYFNDGNYIAAVEDKNASENISRVLYPNDMVEQGRELRLKQEFFFVSATLADALERHKKAHSSLESLPDKAVFQLNDTHPAIAVAELMRILIDEHGFGWDEAFGITQRCLCYTNHTVLPEALETWPVSLLERVLPRHLMIVYELNRRFLEEVRRRFPNDEARVQRMSLFAEGGEKRLRMAHLAIVGSRVTNGVSELHGQILRDSLFRDFADLWPERFQHVTNGITPRRWLEKCNPPLATLISSEIGEGWVTDLDQLVRLVPLASDAGFRERFRATKRANKARLASVLQRVHGIELDPESLLMVQVKRIHEYKRQLLNILHVASLYLRLRAKKNSKLPKRTFLFAGKAAPGYAAAKDIIELIGAVARTIKADPEISQRLAVIFVPNYSVSLAELIIPAADVSEQISLAGTEASGTGNMKLALNGALTVGTLDGATVEIAEAVGRENLFVFGLTASEVEGVRARGYRPREIYAADPEIRGVLDAIARGVFSRHDPGRFTGLVDRLLSDDRFLVLADFQSYRSCHEAVLRDWLRPDDWTRKSILTTARMGRFSSDAVIKKYQSQIWGLES